MNQWLRELFLCASLLACASAHAQQWNFQVFLDDKPIGHHHYTLRASGVSGEGGVGGAERELKTEARFDVKVLFINAYRYMHDANERWRGNCLARLTARTDDNGEHSEVAAEQQGERVTVSSTAATVRGRDSADGCLMTYAYWNADILRQTRLLNTQTGKIETVNIAALGEDKITVRGVPVAAQRYRIGGGKYAIELWYGADKAWLALQTTLDSGRKLRYQLK